MLDDGDKALLGQCPFEVTTIKTRKPTTNEAARLRRITRLWQAGLIGGDVKQNNHIVSVMRITITDKGRAAIGRPPLGGVP